MFEVMCVADVERVELDAYQLKSVAIIWSDQCKKGRVEGATMLILVVFENAFLGCLFPQKLRQAKVR